MFSPLNHFLLFFSMQTLSEMFELEIPTVHSIISKMIINEELMVRFMASLLEVVRRNRNVCSQLNFYKYNLNWKWCPLPVRLHSTSPHRRWWCTAQSPPPCRTWPCSWLRNWAAWWRIMSASLTSSRACMAATSTEVSSEYLCLCFSNPLDVMPCS